MKPIIIHCSVPNKEIGRTIAIALVDEGLVKCVQIIPSISSIYPWEGKILEEEEVLLLLKADGNKYPDIEKFILENHPYKIPEIIISEITGGFQGYINWLKEACIDS